MKTYRMTHLYNDVEKFNEIAGVFEGDLEQAADLYLSLIFEELTEAIEAYEERDKAELIDGCADILVTAMGLAQVLEKAGFDVEKAVKKVAQNNLTKYIDASEEGGMVIPTEYTSTYNDKYKVIVLKDSNGKIRKPPGFQSVVLNDCVPAKGFFK